MMEWQPIEKYPSLAEGDKWGPEVLVLTAPTESYFILSGVKQPPFTISPKRVVAHLEANMWLVRDGGELSSFSELKHPPTHWTSILNEI